MRRAGFALLSVLWSLLLISAVALTAVAGARLGARLTHNRIVLARAAWAAEACGEILAARFARASTFRHLDTVSLGRGTWCTATLTNPGTRLDLNQATRHQLWRLLNADSLVDALRDWIDADSITMQGEFETAWYRGHRRPFPRNGPLASIEELRLVRGFDSLVIATLAPFAAVGNGEPFDPLDAEPRVTSLVLGISPDSAARLRWHRPANYVPGSFVLLATGGVAGSSPEATIRAMVRVSGNRLATLWREVR